MPFFTQISLLRIHQMSLKSDKTNETYGFSVFFLCVNLQNPRNSSSHDNYGPTTQENRKTWIAIITIQDYNEPKHYNCSLTQTEKIVFIFFCKNSQFYLFLIHTILDSFHLIKRGPFPESLYFDSQKQ